MSSVIGQIMVMWCKLLDVHAKLDAVAGAKTGVHGEWGQNSCFCRVLMLMEFKRSNFESCSLYGLFTDHQAWRHYRESIRPSSQVNPRSCQVLQLWLCSYLTQLPLFVHAGCRHCPPLPQCNHPALEYNLTRAAHMPGDCCDRTTCSKKVIICKRFSEHMHSLTETKKWCQMSIDPVWHWTD